MNTMLGSALESIFRPLKNLLDQLAGEKNEIWVKILGQLSRIKPEEILYRLTRKFDHLIDLDTDPYVPSCWLILEHIKGGVIEWNKEKIKLIFPTKQTEAEHPLGKMFRIDTSDESVFNASLLDYLLKNPDLIPDEWKNYYVYFTGTIYHNADGHPCVRGLRFRGHGWIWVYGNLMLRWALTDDRYAVIVES